MMSTASIEQLLGPVKVVLHREVGKKIDHRAVLKVIAVGESVRIRQLHTRLEISENFLLECLKRLTSEGYLELKKKMFAGNECHFYTRLK